MDKLLTFLKFILDNWKAITKVLAFCGIFGFVTYGTYRYTKPVEPHIIPLPLPAQLEPITPPVAPPKPQVIIREVIRSEGCEAICADMINGHEKTFHFVE